MSFCTSTNPENAVKIGQYFMSINIKKLETVSIAEPLQNRQHVQIPYPGQICQLFLQGSRS